MFLVLGLLAQRGLSSVHFWFPDHLLSFIHTIHYSLHPPPPPRHFLKSLHLPPTLGTSLTGTHTLGREAWSSRDQNRPGGRGENCLLTQDRVTSKEQPFQCYEMHVCAMCWTLWVIVYANAVHICGKAYPSPWSRGQTKDTISIQRIDRRIGMIGQIIYMNTYSI